MNINNTNTDEQTNANTNNTNTDKQANTNIFIRALPAVLNKVRPKYRPIYVDVKNAIVFVIIIIKV